MLCGIDPFNASVSVACPYAARIPEKNLQVDVNSFTKRNKGTMAHSEHTVYRIVPQRDAMVLPTHLRSTLPDYGVCTISTVSWTRPAKINS
jgi:hypothetical protein